MVKKWLVILILVLFTVSLVSIQYGDVAAKNIKAFHFRKSKTNNSSKKKDIISESMKVLKRKGIKENTDGMLLLKRYEYYLSEISKGNVFSSYKPYVVPVVYNMVAFSELVWR